MKNYHTHHSLLAPIGILGVYCTRSNAHCQFAHVTNWPAHRQFTVVSIFVPPCRRMRVDGPFSRRR